MASPAHSKLSSPSASSDQVGRRVLLTQRQLRDIIHFAQQIGNDDIIRAITEGLSRSCQVLHPSHLPVRPPDPNLPQRVAALQARAQSVASNTIAMRHPALALLRDRLSEKFSLAFARHTNRPGPIPKPVPSSACLHPHVNASVTRLVSVSSDIRKVRANAADTKRRVKNVRAVLTKLSDDAQRLRQRASKDVSQTIDADWTLMVNENNTPLRTPVSKYMSPIPTSAPFDPEEPDPQSPFVTPRSKARKRAARTLHGIAPIRLDLPR